MPPHASALTTSRWVIGSVLFVMALNVWASWPVIGAYFIGDDFGYVARFNEFRWSEWPSLFVRDWSGGMWGYDLPELRPFSALSFLVDIRLWGPDPLAMHITNLALAVGCALSVGFIAWQISARNLFVGVGAAVVFSLHPAHAEPLGWITGRVDLIGTLCYLLGFVGVLLAFETPRKKTGLALTWGAYFVGVFSKEFCLTLPLLVGLYLAVYRPLTARKWRNEVLVLISGYLAVFLLYWLCRHIAFGHHVKSGAASFNLFTPAYLERQMSYVSWFFPGLLNLGRAIHQPASIGVVQLLGPAIGLALTVVVIVRSFRRAAGPVLKASLFFGLTWYAVATIPLVVAGYFSPRHLFLATAGLAIAISVIIHHAFGSALLKTTAVLLVAALAGFSLNQEIRPWMRAAKITQSTVALLSQETPAANTVWIFDLPDTYHGSWCMAWAVPFCARPPFANQPAAATLESPSLYYAAHRWTADNHLAAAQTASKAVLISLSPPMTVTRRDIPIDLVRTALPLLISKPASKPDQEAWIEFLAKIRRHD